MGNSNVAMKRTTTCKSDMIMKSFSVESDDQRTPSSSRNSSNQHRQREREFQRKKQRREEKIRQMREKWRRNKEHMVNASGMPIQPCTKHIAIESSPQWCGCCW